MLIVNAGCLGLTAAGTAGAASFAPEQLTFFESKIRPVLAENCYQCHGAKKQNNGLRLDSREAVLKGGDYGAVVIPGNPDSSKLVHAISQTRQNGAEPMPKEGTKLPQESIDALREWVRQGLPWPEEAAPATAHATPSAKDHWAFQPVKEPAIPEVKAKDRIAQPMDSFVVKKLEDAGMSLAPKADRATRMRRLQVDLLGYPPTYEEIQQFVNDKSPDAYARLVDRLLASPHFGERWGRYWLDIARYADTKGYVFNEERKYPYSYTYRDWVIRALNADMPYDQFLIQQLAADQANPPDKKENLAALGFITLGRRFLNNEPDIIDDRLDVVFRGTQGMTVACARCHDHKFDPIPTADYYSLYGVFASSTEPKDLPEIATVERTPEVLKYEADLKLKEAKIPSYMQERYTALFKPESLEKYLLATVDSTGKKPEEVKQYAREKGIYLNILERWNTLVSKGNDAVFGIWKSLASVPQPEFATKARQLIDAPDATQKWSPVVLKEVKQAPPANMGELAKIYARLFAQAPPEGETKPEFMPFKQALQSQDGIMGVKPEELEKFFTRPERDKVQEIKKEIDAFKAGSAVAPPRAMAMVDKPQPVEPRIFIRGNQDRQGDKVPRQFLKVLSPTDRKPFTKGSGRLELAQQIASKENPLTARVFVNRVWGHLFGQPMVDTPSDYGVRTKPPANPELLDHLSAAFMAKNWSVKSLIRQIVLSSAYQQESKLRPDCAAKDPDNLLTWRMDRKRLDFEGLRDSLLAVTGNLDEAQFGRPVEIFTAPYSNRRSVYGFIDRQNLPGTFRTFDFSNPDSHSPKRFETTVPQQALYMLNSPFVQELAEKMVRNVSDGSAAEERVKMLFRKVLGRDATADEVKAGISYINQPKLGSPQTGREWSNGFGGWDPVAKKSSFTPFATFTGGKWSPSAKVPDDKYSYANLDANGGHPGPNSQVAVIRRWHAESAGTVRLSGKVDMPAKGGDGAIARVVLNGETQLAEIIIKPTSSAEVVVPTVQVKAGDTIDFILDPGPTDTCDSFVWSPRIKSVANGELLTDAKKDFSGPGSSPWTFLAQALLCANEFVFVD